ncbi:17956_t:CDS:1, partial [Racocetra persica]
DLEYIENGYCQELQNIKYSETGHVVPEFHDGCKGLGKVGYKNDHKYLSDY